MLFIICYIFALSLFQSKVFLECKFLELALTLSSLGICIVVGMDYACEKSDGCGCYIGRWPFELLGLCAVEFKFYLGLQLTVKLFIDSAPKYSL